MVKFTNECNIWGALSEIQILKKYGLPLFLLNCKSRYLQKIGFTQKEKRYIFEEDLCVPG